MIQPDRQPRSGDGDGHRGRAGGSAIAAPVPIAGLATPWIGRDSELQELLERFYTLTEQGGPQLITIVGESGIGKSRLAYEFHTVVSRLPEPVNYLTLRAEQQRSSQPYSLARQLIATLFGLSAQDPPELTLARLEAGVADLVDDDSHEKAHFIGYLADIDLGESTRLSGVIHDARQIRDRALHYVVQCIAASGEQAPIVLVVDDFHHADESSIGLFEQIIQAASRPNLLIICLAQQRLIERRPTWGTSVGGAYQINLQPLDERHSRRLVAEILRKAGKLPADLRNLIVGRAEGNPLYVEELIKMLIADEVILPGADKWQIRVGRLPRLRIPATLRDLLRARLQAISPGERAVLAAAAVIGRSFWRGAVLELLDPDSRAAAADLIGALEAKALISVQARSQLRGELAYSFYHDLLREVLYDQIPADQLVAQHRRVASWLAGRNDDRAESYAGLIAEHFERGGDCRQAGLWYARAGNQARDTYAVEAGIAYYRTALKFLADQPDGARERIACYAGLGYLQQELAHFNEALETYAAMRDLAAQASDLQSEAWALMRLANVSDDRSDPRAIRSYARQSHDLAAQTGDQVQLALSLQMLSLAEIRLGATEHGLALGQHALRIARASGNGPAIAKCLGQLGVNYEHIGDVAAAMQHIHEAIALYRELGNLSEVATQLNNLGYIANSCGNFLVGKQALEEGLQIAGEIGSRLNEIYLLSNLGHTLIGLNDHTGAEAVARRGIHMCEISRVMPFPDFYRDLAEVCLYQGRVGEAVEAAHQGLDLARQQDDPREIGSAWRVLAKAISRMPEPQGARPCFAESARLLGEAGAAIERARTLRDWAEYELHSGDGGRGRELMEEARAIFAQAGMTHELARLDVAP